MSESPIVLSQYDPSGHYFAYLTVSLDKQVIMVENTQTNDVTNNISFHLEIKCTCLTWIKYGENDLISLGLRNGEILLYSPFSNSIVHKLKTGELHEIRDFQSLGNKAWAIDSSDTIYQFNLQDITPETKFKLEQCNNLVKLCIVNSSKILVASHSIFLINMQKKEIILQFPGHITLVNTLLVLNDEFFLSGGENDRFLNIYSLIDGSTKSVLVSQSNIVLVHNDSSNTILTITEDGSLEVFVNPLINLPKNSGNKKRRHNISKKSNKYLKLVRSESLNSLPILNGFISNDIINFTWLENAIVPHFQQLLWETMDEFVTIKKAIPSSTKLSKDISLVTNYQEGNATVTSGDNFRHLQNIINDLDDIDDKNDWSTTFGDKLKTLHPHNKFKKRATTGTLTVVLSQALQSNDHSLLETVLNTRDEKVITSTVSRLSPQLSVILLERLAERIARQTHRQGPLNVWVKWCIIIHGGYLITIPNLLSSLSSLHSILKKRCDLLPRLQVLETRLDHSLNKLEFKRLDIGNSIDDTNITLWNQDEEDQVEYNEELDDANLIDDGEYDSDKSNESDSKLLKSCQNNDDRFIYNNNSSTNEDGYSDIEV